MSQVKPWYSYQVETQISIKGIRKISLNPEVYKDTLSHSIYIQETYSKEINGKVMHILIHRSSLGFDSSQWHINENKTVLINQLQPPSPICTHLLFTSDLLFRSAYAYLLKQLFAAGTGLLIPLTSSVPLAVSVRSSYLVMYGLCDNFNFPSSFHYQY